jgi:hypothetical protein
MRLCLRDKLPAHVGIIFILAVIIAGLRLTAVYAEQQVLSIGPDFDVSASSTRLHIQYMGDEPIVVKEIKINRGVDCFAIDRLRASIGLGSPKTPEEESALQLLYKSRGEKKLPLQMKFGDEATWQLACKPIEVQISTDKGDIYFSK